MKTWIFVQNFALLHDAPRLQFSISTRRQLLPAFSIWLLFDGKCNFIFFYRIWSIAGCLGAVKIPDFLCSQKECGWERKTRSSVGTCSPFLLIKKKEEKSLSMAFFSSSSTSIVCVIFLIRRIAPWEPKAQGIERQRTRTGWLELWWWRFVSSSAVWTWTWWPTERSFFLPSHMEFRSSGYSHFAVLFFSPSSELSAAKKRKKRIGFILPLST